MSTEKLADLLRQLQAELAEANDLDDDLTEQLQAATADIEIKLAADEALQATKREAAAKLAAGESDDGDTMPQDNNTFAGQFREAAERFEDSHPHLTHTVGRIADALAQLGI